MGISGLEMRNKKIHDLSLGLGARPLWNSPQATSSASTAGVVGGG